MFVPVLEFIMNSLLLDNIINKCAVLLITVWLFGMVNQKALLLISNELNFHEKSSFQTLENLLAYKKPEMVR
ncbi:MAG: hypothetical protein AN486_24290 [Anabaena sp. AL93]|nr:MAG: hypothetical protein AN486_24290 [Anabaena sp. AL93]